MPNLRLIDHLQMSCRQMELQTGGRLSAAALESSGGYKKMMKTLVPELLRHDPGLTPDQAFAQASAMLAQFTFSNPDILVVIGDNIAERVLEDEPSFALEDDSEKFLFDPSGFQELIAAPPFKKCFLEWRWPERYRKSREWDERLAGLMLYVWDSDTIKDEPLARQMIENTKAAGYAVDDTRWYFMAYGYGLNSRGQPTVSKYVQFAVLDEEGHPTMFWSSAMTDPRNVRNTASGRPAVDDPEQRNMLIVLRMFDFLNCRNVDCVETLEYQQTPRWYRRQKLPTIKHYTLRVRKSAKKTASSVISDETVERAQHICRGHFRDYTEEKPLFGKYSGRFWINQHVRGSEDVGTVEKRYELVEDG